MNVREAVSWRAAGRRSGDRLVGAPGGSCPTAPQGRSSRACRRHVPEDGVYALFLDEM